MLFLKFFPKEKHKHPVYLTRMIHLRRLRRFLALFPSSDWLDEVSICSFCLRMEIDGIRLFFSLASLSTGFLLALSKEEWFSSSAVKKGKLQMWNIQKKKFCLVLLLLWNEEDAVKRLPNYCLKYLNSSQNGAFIPNFSSPKQLCTLLLFTCNF